MIEIIDVEAHNTMCGGMTYLGTASFEGRTVKEVLDEIREFSKNNNANYLGDGFGNSDNKNDAWSISIDDNIYWSSWVNVKPKEYNHTLDDLEVEKINIDGGWHSFYNFNIYTKSYKENNLKCLKDKIKTRLSTIKQKS